MTEITHHIVVVKYRDGSHDTFDIVKNKPSKITFYSANGYPGHQETATPDELYEAFLPNSGLRGIELHAPDGHRIYVDIPAIATVSLHPFRST